MSEATLIQALEAVKDGDSFLAFARALFFPSGLTPGQNYALGYEDWGNITIDGFLEGAIACMEDHGDDGVFSIEPTWRTFAEFLYGGKIYQ